MIFIFIVLFGVLLQSTAARAKDYQVDFKNFCDLYGKLRTDGNVNSMKQEVDGKILQGLPSWNPNHCAQRQNYLKAECLAYKRRNITTNNGDWSRFFDNGRNRQVLPLYTDLWLLHPQMKECAKNLKKPPEKNDAKVKILRGLNGENAGDYAEIFTNKNGKSMLREEIEVLCGTDNELEDTLFCPGLLEMIRLADTCEFVTDENRYGYWLQIAMVETNNPQFKMPKEEGKTINELIFKIMEKILTYTRYRQRAKIIDLLSVMPEKSQINSCQDLSKVLWKTLNLVRTYVESTAPMKFGKGSVILNSDIDYKKYLEMKQMKEILQSVRENNKMLGKLGKWVTREVRKDVNRRFEGLRTYFKTAATFNKEKAKADINFIKDRLSSYQSSVKSLKESLSSELGKIIKLAFVAVRSEIAENTVQVALAYGVCANPLEKLFGGESVGSLMDRTAKLFNSFTNILQLRRAAESYKEVRERTNEIGQKFAHNDDFLGNISTLLNGVDENQPMEEFATERKRFLECYAAYNPRVQRPELTAMSTVYGGLVDACCDVIMSQESNLAALAKGTVKESGLCPKTKEVAEKMFETFAEIYDFQFDLIEAMADYMRAANNFNAATGIAEDYDGIGTNQNQDSLTELKLMSTFSLISYKLDIWEITNSYCDILTYKRGGYPLSVCQEKERSIDRLVSKEVTCSLKTLQGAGVPIRSDTGDQGFMNLTDLYAGRDVIFKIPNSQWLLDNEWISHRDKDSAILVEKFEVFLPTVSESPRLVEVQAIEDGYNRLSASSNNTRYEIVPKKTLIFQYKEGKGSEEACRHTDQVLSNPYVRRNSPSPKLCSITVEDRERKTALFPSVYSRWKINVSGYETVPVPKPTNDDFKLRVGIKLCIQRPRRNKQGKDDQPKTVNNKFKVQERPSCPKQKYWSEKAGRCVNCPEGSEPALDGYFCVEILDRLVNSNNGKPS